MSSNNEEDDDLEERKGEIWSMDEVRGGGSSGTPDTEEAAETEDTSDTADTEDTAEEGPTTSTSEPEDTPDTTDTTDTADTSDTADTPDETDEEPAQADGETVRQMAIDADAKGIAVRDLHNVNVYLYESVYMEMRGKYKELDTEYFDAHGEDLSKNKDFFNAVFRAGLQSPKLKEELEIE